MTDTRTRVAVAPRVAEAAADLRKAWEWFDWADPEYVDAAAIAVTAAEVRLGAELARARAEREASR